MDEVTSQVDSYSQDLEDPGKQESSLQEGFLNLEFLSVDICDWESFTIHIEEGVDRHPVVKSWFMANIKV